MDLRCSFFGHTWFHVGNLTYVRRTGPDPFNVYSLVECTDEICSRCGRERRSLLSVVDSWFDDGKEGPEWLHTEPTFSPLEGEWIS